MGLFGKSDDQKYWEWQERNSPKARRGAQEALEALRSGKCPKCGSVLHMDIARRGTGGRAIGAGALGWLVLGPLGGLVGAAAGGLGGGSMLRQACPSCGLFRETELLP